MKNEIEEVSELLYPALNQDKTAGFNSLIKTFTPKQIPKFFKFTQNCGFEEQG